MLHTNSSWNVQVGRFSLFFIILIGLLHIWTEKSRGFISKYTKFSLYYGEIDNFFPSIENLSDTKYGLLKHGILLTTQLIDVSSQRFYSILILKKMLFVLQERSLFYPMVSYWIRRKPENIELDIFTIPSASFHQFINFDFIGIGIDQLDNRHQIECRLLGSIHQHLLYQQIHQSLHSSTCNVRKLKN